MIGPTMHKYMQLYHSFTRRTCTQCALPYSLIAQQSKLAPLTLALQAILHVTTRIRLEGLSATQHFVGDIEISGLSI